MEVLQNEAQTKEWPIKLDYSLKLPQERLELVNEILEKAPSTALTPRYLEILADYIIFTMDSTEQRQRKILTENRLKTINKREMYIEELTNKFKAGNNEEENGNEDSFYNLIINDKNVYLTPRSKITDEDRNEIPGLKELNDQIENLERAFEKAKGKAKFNIKQNIIALRKDQYVLRASYKKPINVTNAIKNANETEFWEDITVNKDGELEIKCNMSLLCPQHISVLLCNYSKMKEDSWGNFTSDTSYLIWSLEELVQEALKDHPMFYDIVVYKIDGKTNLEIRDTLQKDYGTTYSSEYISSLWRKKIPTMIAKKAQEQWITWYYTNEKKGKWKRCSKCKEIKLAHPMFFSKNKSSKDGYYSVCKECRNKKPVKLIKQIRR